MVDFVCIGVPYYIGEHKAGRDEVAKVKASGIADQLGAPWVDIEPDFAHVPDRLIAINQAIAAVIQAHPERLPLVFASDCTSVLGIMKGLEAQQPDILWYDAHGDFNTPETTPSGFLGGMPLAWLVGRGDMRYMDGVGLKPISETAVTVTDGRNLDPEEGEALYASDVTLYEKVSSLLQASWSGKPLYIHFDTDVIDTAEMPALNYPEPDGPSVAETAETLHHVVSESQVVGVLFSLWNDTLPGAETARDSTLSLVQTLVDALT
jgi:arginase